MEKIKIFLIFSILLKCSFVKACDSESKIKKYFSKNANPKYDLFENFNSFTELKLDCSQKYNNTGFVVFNPNYRIIVDRTFNLTDILLNQSATSISLIYFKGIDIKSEPSSYIINELIFLFSKLNFYINGSLVTEKNCNSSSFTESHSLFLNFYSILIYASYEQPLCPFVFQNTNLEYLFLSDISNSLINKNILTITDTKEIMNNNIKNLFLDIAYHDLTTSLMNENLFSSLIGLRVYGCLNSIQAHLFADFKSLKTIDFQLDNLNSFFHNGNEWMASLNKNIKVNLNNHFDFYNNYKSSLKIRFLYKQKKSVINKVYTYPDEDFCLFKHFPHDHLVVPIILPGKRIECSCTLLWLIQYYWLYFLIDYKKDYEPSVNYFFANNDTNLEDKNHIINYCHDEHLAESISKCNFEQRLKLCNKTTFLYQSKSILDNDTDLYYFIKWIQFIIIILIQPILSILGIINSLVTVYVIQRKETKKKFNDKMYKHIAINCVFSIFFCIITLFGLVNQCLFYNTNVFCSKINQYESTQYFTIIVIYYLGNSVKLCKNISFLAFTFSRYILSINKTKGIYDKFNKMNLKLYVFIIIITSSLLSSYKLFEYSVLPSFSLFLSNPKEKSNRKECNLNFTAYCYIFLAINYFINDFLLYLINFLIDVKLVIDYNAYLKNKQKLLSTTKNIQSIDKTHHIHNEWTKKKENKVTRMVVISNMLYLLTSIPELVSSILVNVFSSSLSQNSGYNYSTSLFTNESEVFCLLSIVFNFYILVFFNHNFKKSLLLGLNFKRN